MKMDIIKHWLSVRIPSSEEEAVIIPNMVQMMFLTILLPVLMVL